MPGSHGRQKQLQKQKKRRAAARKQESARQASLILPRSKQALIQRAVSLPHGPAFISPSYREDNESMPALVMVLVTRRAPGGLLVPATAVVDRTCLGVKDGCLGRPVTELELDEYRDQLAVGLGQAMEPCDLLVAQSVVFHALDYARSFGFAPHRDFPAPLFGPRPERLLDTPLARPSRPVFISGPDDDVPRILDKLRFAAGDNFAFVAGAPGLPFGGAGPLFDENDLDEDDLDEELDDEGEEDDAEDKA